MIDITTTATLRSEILDRTLSSFKEKLFKKHDCRLIMNIDPVGPDTIQNVQDVAMKYFNNIIFNVPDKPNFSRAFLWVFSQATSEYIFNLEDDWVLLREVDLSDMIRVMDLNPELATLRLSYRISEERSKQWNLFFDYDAYREIFLCPPEARVRAGFCGHPSLIRNSFIKNCLRYINPNKNPEKEFHVGGPFQLHHIVNQYDYAVYQKQHEGAYILDIGRKWLQETNWQKKGNKAFFNEWERKENIQ